jgi:hypothetical protein
MLADALAQEQRVAGSDLIDTVHVENVNVPSTRDRLRRCFSLLLPLVGSGSFILGLNCIAYRSGSGHLLLRRGLLRRSRRGNKQDNCQSDSTPQNGKSHTRILLF